MPGFRSGGAKRLVLDGISRRVDREAHLSGVRMEFEPGSLTVLLGHTRAGKTTLLRCMAGLDRVTSGRILWGEVDVTGADARSRDVAMVYQQFVNYPSLTVYENIASPLRIKKLAEIEIDRRVRATAKLLHIEALLQRLPSELSGGQQQRAAIARALVKDAGLVLLDEPLANLDYKLREELRSELRALFRDRDCVVVYATAEPEEALVLGGRSAVIDEGRVLQTGAALDVYQRPATERVARIFSNPDMNILPILVISNEARLGETVRFPLRHHLRGLAPGPCRLGVRANHVCLRQTADDDIRLPATALLEETNGSETLIHASCAGTTILAQVPGLHRPMLGSPVDLFIAPSSIFAFGADGQLLACSSPSSMPTTLSGADVAN